MATMEEGEMDVGLYSVELSETQDTNGYRRYRDLPHRSFNETLKSHSSFAVKLSETGKLNLSLFDFVLRAHG